MLLGFLQQLAAVSFVTCNISILLCQGLHEENDTILIFAGSKNTNEPRKTQHCCSKSPVSS